MSEHNIVSVSGGKDSTALLLLAIERQPENLSAVFADTGNEHELTYEYVQYLNDNVFPIRTVKADFTRQIAGKREFVRTHWPLLLAKGKPGTDGYWTRIVGVVEYDENDEEVIDEPKFPMPPVPSDVFKVVKTEDWAWVPAKRPVLRLTDEEITLVVDRALAMLVPTGIPFLDLCIWKGRFPSARAAFCSEELKRNPILHQVQKPLLDAGHDVISWQGVRRDESLRRSLLVERECKSTHKENGAELWNFRPILDWTAEDCFAMHRKHGVKHNPLYEMGMGRVGCMPCINCRKDELLEISKRFPEVIERIRQWEDAVRQASKKNGATFFAAANQGDNLTVEEAVAIANIDAVVEWAKTGRGGRQFDFLRTMDDGPACSSIYGLCE